MVKRVLASVLFGAALLFIMGCTAEIGVMTNGHVELEERESVARAVSRGEYRLGPGILADVHVEGLGSAASAGTSVARTAPVPVQAEPDAASQAPELTFTRPFFVGNSLTEGMRLNCPDDYDFYCKVGVWLPTLTGNLDKISLPDGYDCVIIEMGTNELGAYARDRFVSEYAALAGKFDVPCFCLSIPPVCEAKSRYDGRICNSNVELYNTYIRDFCDGSGCVFVDCSEFFGDDLDPSWTGDGIHLSSEVYADWYTWVCDYVLNRDWGERFAS